MMMSELLSGRAFTEETRKKLSDSKKGNKYHLGKHLSEETKKKLSEVHKGIVTKGTTGMKWKLIDGKRIYYKI